jgi:Right handed beta helix region
MAKTASLSTIAGALLAFGLFAAPAQAGPGTGTDSGACTRAAPCRTFAFALTQTNAGGEIDVLDPAGYGAVTITKAISIVSDGAGVAAIGVSSGNAITIDAGPNDSVHLRGLTIEGLGSGTNGILFNTGGNLAIENCVVRGFGTAGINISPSTSSSFSVANTIASNNGLHSSGIFIQPTGSALVTGVLSKVITNNNGGGIELGNRSTAVAALNVVIVDSEASNNGGGIGVAAGGVEGGPIAVLLCNVVASNNFMGLDAVTNAVLRIAHSVVTGNTTGVNAQGGTLLTYGDNDIDGNANNNTGVLTVIPTH